MNILDEAVEAAAKALYKGQPLYDEAAGVITGHKPWEWTEPAHQGSMLAEARAALEAAAPYMHAHALDDAVAAFPLETIVAPDNAVVWMMRRAEELRTNPYRSQA